MGSFRDEVEMLYQETGRGLFAYARSILRDAATAEDAVHQVFLNLLSKPWDALPREPRPYLFRAVRNACSNQRRSEQRESSRRRNSPMFVASDGLGELADQLESALLDLPLEQREVVVLRIWGQLTLEAAAEVVGVSANTAASRYRYALAKLRDRFGAQARC